MNSSIGLTSSPAKLDSGATLITSGTIGAVEGVDNTLAFLIEVAKVESEERSLVHISLSNLDFDVDLALFNEQLIELDSSINTGANDELISLMLKPGIYAVRVRNPSTEISNYTLKITRKNLGPTQNLEQDPSSTIETATDIGTLNKQKPIGIKQVIAAEDKDAYKVSLPESLKWPTKVRITATATATATATETLGISSDLVLEIYDYNGQNIATVDDTAVDIETTDVSVGPGDLFIVVRGYDQDTESKYTLSVELVD